MTATFVPTPRVNNLKTAAFEALEQRRLLAFTGSNFELPFANDFRFQRNGVEDAGGRNTGFPIVQGNTAGDEYQPGLIDLDLENGKLLMTSRGDASAGSNFGADNTLANGLQVPFDAAQGTWLASTRVSDFNAPLTQFDTAFEQAGLLVGPTQDNYVKLVFGHDGSNTVVQFLAETTQGGQIVYPLGTDGVKSVVSGVNLSTAGHVDLWLSGDPSTGVISAQYRVDGGPVVRFEETLDLTGPVRDRFFRADTARAGLMVAHKNDVEPMTAAFDRFEVRRASLPGDGPQVLEVRPGAGATDVARDTFIAVDLDLPNGSVDSTTLTSDHVRLIRVSDGRQVEAGVNTSGGGDAIVLNPARALDAESLYRFEITSGVQDVTGVAFEPFSATFTTGFEIGETRGGVAFDPVVLQGTQNVRWTGLEIGPDGRLYGLSYDGLIRRWDLNDDGTLGQAQTITSLQTAEGGPRLATGLVFTPGATAGSLEAIVTHTEFGAENPQDLNQSAADFTGKITRLSGPDLGTVQDLVVGLPRSIRDHVTNQPTFGPDGRLYVAQGANTAMGAPDAAWGFRPERELTAAVLALDLSQLGDAPLDVRTDGNNPYDPSAAGAPLTIFATGVRNAFSLLWHSNGNLYAPVNGSAAGGNAPGSPDGTVPALENVRQTLGDYLLRVDQGGYYGHPNPQRNEFVLFGGNPTSGDDPAQINAYPVGTQPEPNYRGFEFEFPLNSSPNGIIEYTGDAFGGELDGKLIITRYSGGDDAVVVTLDDAGNVADVQFGLFGLGGFNDPLDVVQGPNGQLYVGEFGGQQISLLRPVDAGGRAAVESRRIYANGPAGQPTLVPFTVRNDGNTTLLLSPFTLTIVGQDKDRFEFVNVPEGAIAVAPGERFTFDVAVTPPAGTPAGNILEATVAVRTNDPDAPEVGSRVSTLVTGGQFGAAEPSLQRILDLYGFGIDTGDDNPADNNLVPGGDRIDAPLFVAADPSRPVIAVPVASFGPDTTPAATAGFYRPGLVESRRTLHEITGIQTVFPEFSGAVKFDPGPDPFGLWMQTAAFVDGPGGNGRARVVWSEPQLNDWIANPANRDQFVAYPIRLADGTLLPDSYVVAFEEFEPASDFNDIVMIVRNVRPAGTGEGRLAFRSGLGLPLADRLVFSEIDPADRDNRFGTQQVRNSQAAIFRNTGDQPVTVNGATTEGPFTVDSFAPATLNPGQELTLTVNFTATDADLPSGELAASLFGEMSLNVTGGSAPAVDLAGFYMTYSEDDVASGTQKANIEPTFPQIIDLMGWQVDVGTVEDLDNFGILEAVGDEILSPYWRATGTQKPVEVYQLAAYHNMGTSDPVRWFARGQDPQFTTIFTHNNVWAQSMLPGLTGAANSPLAAGSFVPGNADFGIRVVNERSDPELNANPNPPPPPGSPQGDNHRMRFWPIRDSAGDLVEDTWVMTMDFDGFNYDFNDNVYLFRNMRPAEGPQAPRGVSAFRGGSGEVVVNWAGSVNDGRRFTAFRSTDGQDFQPLFGGSSVTRTFFSDTPPAGETFYRVFAVDDAGNPGPMFGEARIVA